MREILLVDGVVRFKANAVLQWLADQGDIDLNKIARRLNSFPVEDVEEFWQMLGYSVSGFGDLDFVRADTVAAADVEAERILSQDGPVPEVGQG